MKTLKSWEIVVLQEELLEELTEAMGHRAVFAEVVNDNSRYLPVRCLKIGDYVFMTRDIEEGLKL